MRSDRAPTPDVVRRQAQVIRHPSATPAQVAAGTATDGIDLGPYAERITHTFDQAQVRLRWRAELYGADQPAPGELLELRSDGATVWSGIIESVNDYRETRGERSMSITARSRDASPAWRELRRTTAIYPIMTSVDAICADVAAALGLTSADAAPVSTGLFTPHSNVQLADLTAWQMLQTLLLPAGLEPWVDALGVLRAISRDTTRETDLAIPAERVVAISGARHRPPISSVQLRWLDPQLVKVSQQDQALATAAVTAGFFKLRHERPVYWSEDRRQRAESTYLVVKQSVNSGLLPVGDERYEATGPTEGKIIVETRSWVPGLATLSIAALLAASHLPDYAPPGGGPTIPTGKIVHGAAEAAILLILMSLGVGQYEVRGTPYDYVHARNTTEAVATGSKPWAVAVQELESDLIRDEAHAQAVAARELLYAVRSAQTWQADIVDDPRIERGDILALPDGSRLYVTDAARDLSRGAQAILKVTGFRV